MLVFAAVNLALMGGLFALFYDVNDGEGRSCRWLGGPYIGLGVVAIAAALAVLAVAASRPSTGTWSARRVRLGGALPLAILGVTLIVLGLGSGCTLAAPPV